MSSEIRFPGDLQRLELRPGDRFVLTAEGPISIEMAERIQRSWHEFTGGDDKRFPLIILADGLKLGVISTGVDDVE